MARQVFSGRLDDGRYPPARCCLFRAGERPLKVVFPLVRELAIPAAAASRVLKISRSRYYDWLGRPESPRDLRNKELTKMIREIHAE